MGMGRGVRGALIWGGIEVENNGEEGWSWSNTIRMGLLRTKSETR